MPLPNVEDLSDRALSDWGSVYDVSITRPPQTFFPGFHQNFVCPPRDLEEGRLNKHNYTSRETLIAEKTDTHDFAADSEKSSKHLIPTRHSVHSIHSTKPPAKKGPRLYRFLRWNYGSVYRRILCLAVLGNILAIILVLLHNFWTGSSLSFTTASTAAASNILAAIIVRNEHFVNTLFVTFGSWPRKLPLSIRRIFAKVYSYGGIHSGCSIAATLWYIVFLRLMTNDFATTGMSALRDCIYFVSYTVIVLLCLIIIFALPRVRICIHDWFEGMHRFRGWTAVLLFWAQTFLLTADAASSKKMSYAMVLVATPTFWILVVITLLIVYSWTRLRLRDVEAEVLSDHCVKLNFKYANVQYGQAVRLSDVPLKETHAFAVIPNPVVPVTTLDQKHAPHSHQRAASISTDITTAAEKSTTLSTTKSTTTPSPFPANQKGFSVLVSDAGDWTQKIIRNPPPRVYVRGVPQYGVLRIAGLFSPVIIVATGSGIGPCLSLFVQKPDHPVRVIWSAPCPSKTYGQGVVDLIYRTDPGAVIIDTKTTGRVDLVGLVWRVWEGSRMEGWREDVLGDRGVGRGNGKCEAVVVISNQKVTRKLVYGLESRGVPAYGAIFDS